MKEILTMRDFKRKKVGESEYLGHDFDGKEICIERLITGGFYVAIYDERENLLEPKLKTEEEGFFESMFEALLLANELKARHSNI